MSKLIDVFDKHTKHLKFDKKLLNKLIEFRIVWINKNADHIAFLGGNLLGVNNLVFSVIDDTALIEEVFEIDLKEIRNDFHALEDINTSWKVSSNPVYLTLTCALYKYYMTEHNTKKYNAIATELGLLMLYKMTGSMQSNFFEYNTTESIALTTYENLSNRYLIKKLSTWQEVFEHMTRKLHIPEGLHIDRISKMNELEAIRLINDMQVGVKGIIINMYGVMKDVIDNYDTIKLQSTMNSNAEMGIGNLDTRPDKYVDHLLDIRLKRNDLIKMDLLALVVKLFPSVGMDNVKESLVYISEGYAENEKITEIISTVLERSIEYLMRKDGTNDYSTDVMENLKKLKNYWNNSSVKERDVVRMKKHITKIVKDATGKRTDWVVTTIASTLILYFFLRAIAMNAYN